MLYFIDETEHGFLKIQEYYIRHADGTPVNTEGEEERVVRCIKAAILRRVSEVRNISFKGIFGI